jgi:hypothetical protein
VDQVNAALDTSAARMLAPENVQALLIRSLGALNG